MKNLIVASLTAFLAACGPAYEANFTGLNLGCCIVRDTLHTPSGQPMQKGISGLAGEIARLNPGSGTLQMEAKAPKGTVAGSGVASTIGVYSTQLSFGPNDHGEGAYAISATFRAPTRAQTDNPWSLLLIMRDPQSAADDLNGPRMQLSLRTVGMGAARDVEFRVQEMPDPANPSAPTTKLGTPIKLVGTPALVDIDAGNPFKMSLIINRHQGKGWAVLSTPSDNKEIPEFTMNLFTNKPTDPIIHTVGAALANTDPDNTASVEISHFEILTN